MVGIVVVSHSATLAEGVVELARGMAGPDVPIEAAGGIEEPGELGTDAVKVMEAIERAGDGDVLVLMDLGSAVLSAETALDFLPDDRRDQVLLCEAPVVEGAVAAAAAARAGGSLEDVAREARGGLAGKVAHLGHGDGSVGVSAPDEGGPADEEDGAPWTTAETVVAAPHGLHARPAAAVVRAAADAEAEVRLRNLTTGAGPAPGTSLTALATLGALEGHRVGIEARGPGAEAAIAAVRAIVEDDERGGPSARPEAAAEEEPAPAVAPSPPAPGEEVRGVPAAPGRGAGPARVRGGAPELPDEPAGDPEAEAAALDAALARSGRELEELRAAADPETADILAAQALMVSDEALLGPARRAIAAGVPAARAFHDATIAAAAAYDALDDPYMRARRDDVLDLGRHVAGILTGAADAGPRAGVIVAADLGAAEVASLDPAVVAAVVTAGGGPTSHASIIARALGIPAVAGIGPGILELAEGTTLLVDGDAGTVVADPGPDAIALHEARVAEDRAVAEEARAHAHEPAVTRDGRHVEVAANAGAPGDLEAGVAAGADGVGLFRSEFLYLARRDAPDEAEQRSAYTAAVEALGGRRLVLRTLDAGADKPLPYLAMPPEENPFLGVRGLRLSLARPEVLRTQLRAALAASAHGPVSIMFPMVSELRELHEAKAILGEAREALAGEGVAAGEVEVGAMVEVPALALLADAVVPEVDFLSVGTNDLTQYALAAERGNGALARLSDPVHPAVLRLIAGVCEAAAPHGCRVAVCGEAGSDPVAVPLLVGLGVDELSVAPPRVALVKQWVRALDRAEAAELARLALAAADADAVRRLVAVSGSA
ncbi:MAG: phosphoenolpyruvate--protein phosphotransferase [Thermoleophilia bacterium]